MNRVLNKQLCLPRLSYKEGQRNVFEMLPGTPPGHSTSQNSCIYFAWGCDSNTRQHAGLQGTVVELGNRNCESVWCFEAKVLLCRMSRSTNNRPSSIHGKLHISGCLRGIGKLLLLVKVSAEMHSFNRGECLPRQCCIVIQLKVHLVWDIVLFCKCVSDPK